MEKSYKQEHFFQVFGHICIFFTTLDVLVSILFNSLVKEEKKMKLAKSGKITNKTTLGNKLKVLKALSPEEVVSESIFQDMQSFIDVAIGVGEKRNRYIHDVWEFNTERTASGIITRCYTEITSTGEFNYKKIEQLTIDDLVVLVGEIGEMQKKFGGLLDEMGKKR